MKSGTTHMRIVSRGAYAAAKAKRLFWWIDGLLLNVAAFVCVAIALCFVCDLLRFAPWEVLRRLATTHLIWLLLVLPALMNLFSALANGCFTRSRNVATGTLWLRRTINLVPDEESLVRASVEPVQGQQGILLRSAQQGGDTPQEQLVRAVR